MIERLGNRGADLGRQEIAVVHAIKWMLQHRYMQIEGMAEFTPPLIDPESAKLPPMAA